jgi:hypothetical protein
MRHLHATGILTLVLAAGCGDARTQPPEAEPVPPKIVDLGADFDAGTARTLTGHVAWRGEIPRVPPFPIIFNDESSPLLREALDRPNPNAPKVDPHTRGVAGAVVFLRGVEPRRSRPWDLPHVTVAFRDRQIHVLQGDTDAATGFVRQGASIEMVSKEPACHSLHACGASFFTLSFPDPDQPLTRTLPEKGVVELSSNAGFFWMRGYLFVTEHPYFSRTDAAGRFTLRDVPPGEYELVAWLPSWKVKSYDRDPETGFRSRVRFAAPHEVVRKIRIAAEPVAEQIIEIGE